MKRFYKIASRPIVYHVDEKNRVVVAIMHNTEDILTDYLFDTDLGQKKAGVAIAALALPDSYLAMNSFYSARVFCHPDDKFDPEIGKKLAEKKLMNNVYKGFSKRLLRYTKHLQKHHEQILDDLKQIEVCIHGDVNNA